MSGMAEMDARSAGKTRALARAKMAAWMVALSMAATTMTFQVYHSIIYGRMPWELAVLYGVVPLTISMLILEIVAEWEHAPWWGKAGAFAVMAGALYLSASATGDVVLHAAPGHMSWLFGVLLDGAALLAVHFILNGPRAADIARAATAEAAARSKREAELVAAAESARAEADASRLAQERAEAARTEAEAKAEILTRKLDAASARKPAPATGRKAPRKPAPATGRKGPEVTGPEVPDATADLDSEALVLRYLSEGKSASEAGRLAGLSDARGRQIARKLAKAGPADPFGGAQDGREP